MRQQMFKTMVAMEKMADAVTDFLGRTGAQWPAAGSMVAGQTTEAAEPPRAPTGDELEKIGKVVAKHHQALAVIATYGVFKDAGFFGTQPDRKLTSLLGMKACDECVGTGWIARDESCKKCGRTGYVKS